MRKLLVKNGRVWTDGQLRDVDVLSVDERIAGIFAHGTDLSGHDAEVIDAKGGWVLPGLIDTHVHFREPGYEYKETHESGSRAAAAGGITMYIDMPNVKPAPNTVEAFVNHRALAKKGALIDFNHWAIPFLLEQIPGIAAEGAVGFKFFQKDAHYPYDGGVGIRDHYKMLEIFRAVAPTGLPCLVHTHDQDIWEAKTKLWTERQDTGLAAWREVSYGDECISQTSGLSLVVLMGDLTGCRVRPLHVQSKGQFKLVRALRNGGYKFDTEMNPSAVFTVEPLGKRGPGDVEANWEALEDGTIDMIGSDHAPHGQEEAEKAKISSFQSVVGTFPWVEHWAALFLTEVAQSKLSLKRFVELTSLTPAKHLGVYPRKGSITVGSDADIAVFEIGCKAVIGKDLPVYSKAGATQMAGTVCTVRPTQTIVRGRVVFNQGKFPIGAGYGEFIRPL